MDDTYIKHYGILRKSGRYPWGSGGNDSGFLKFVGDLKNEGLSETEIAEACGMNTSQLRAKKTSSLESERAAKCATVIKLKAKGMSNTAIGEQMGINESSVRSLLNPSIKRSKSSSHKAFELLTDQVDKGNYVDVGHGTELNLGISKTKLNSAIAEARDAGYSFYYIPVTQLGTNKQTLIKVLAKPDDTWSDVYKNQMNIKPAGFYSEDRGITFETKMPYVNLDSKRIKIRYAEDGGTLKDGVIELRPGKEDLNLGSARYAQVRIAVDNKSYLKGMTMYSDNIPNGYDVVFNTNKKLGTPPEKVFKPLDPSADNPFGATVRQKTYIDKNGKKQQSALNIVNEEGDWSKWSKNLSKQMLSKQDTKLAKELLGKDQEAREADYQEIMSLTNPSIRRKLLQDHADGCDAASVHLKAAAVSRQGSYVLLPDPTMKETQIYAPKFNNGESVVLIRYPHGGIFEIPSLTVNNNQPDLKKNFGNVQDAVFIHPKVASQLSGADFDGDTAIVIPNNKGKIKHTDPLLKLKDFEPKDSYPGYPGMKVMTNKQTEMGKISNLITDMTVKGANTDEICMAVKHSMVVIDSVKHELNYKQSYIDNNIAALKKKYQPDGGASTLISRGSSDVRVNSRKEYVDPKTGKKKYEYKNETYIDAKGKTVFRTQGSKKMLEVDDANELSSGTKIERVYAKQANDLKRMANRSRKALADTENIPYSPEAKAKYSKEVESLNAKLVLAVKNAPKERQAQIVANEIVSDYKTKHPDVEKDRLKKVKGQALTTARKVVGAKKPVIEILPKEWDAIQEGAISTSKLDQILKNTDTESVRKLATPHPEHIIPNSTLLRAKTLLRNGGTFAEVAEATGVSVSTLQKEVNQ